MTMSQFHNNPGIRDEQGTGQIKRYIHQPLTGDHYGIHYSIQENGKVLISSGGTKVGDDIEYDEIEVPASLVFKLAMLLKATRTIKFVSVSEVKDAAE
jgi:hypothetical protein